MASNTGTGGELPSISDPEGAELLKWQLLSIGGWIVCGIMLIVIIILAINLANAKKKK